MGTQSIVCQTKSRLSGSKQKAKELEMTDKPREPSFYEEVAGADL